MKKKNVYYLILVGIAFFWSLPFIIPDKVPTLHALSFLIHQDGIWYIPLRIGCAVWSYITVKKSVKQDDKVTQFSWYWVVLFLAVFAVPAALSSTRTAAGHDPNVGFRYHQYMESKGWTK